MYASLSFKIIAFLQAMTYLRLESVRSVPNYVTARFARHGMLANIQIQVTLALINYVYNFCWVINLN